jgi:hypothetical protein
MTYPFGNSSSNSLMKKSEIDIEKFREKIRKGLTLSFEKLLIQKKAQNGVIVLSEKGQIKKIKATDIKY